MLPPSPDPVRGSLSLETGLALVLCLWAVLGSAAFLELDHGYRLDVETMRAGGPSSAEAHWQRSAIQPPPLVVLVSVDTLRADRLPLYGYGRDTAPHLTALGASSLVFERAWSQSAQTLTSHKSLFTGKYPERLIREQAGARELPRDGTAARRFLVETFAGVTTELGTALRSAGYRTAAFTDGGWMLGELGFATGFDHFDQKAGGFDGVLPRAIRWLEQEPPDRTFLFVHGYDVHCPYVSEPRFDDRFCPDHARHLDLAGRCGKGQMTPGTLSADDFHGVSDHYDAGIAAADEHLGRFFAELRARGLFDEALIVVLSDHGESLGERPYVGHGGLWPEQLAVPLVIKPPASWGLRAGRFAEPVELVDVLPTLLEACGAEPCDGDGFSLFALAAGSTSWPRTVQRSQTTFEDPLEGSSAVRSAFHMAARWHAIHDPHSDHGLWLDLEEPGGLLQARPIPEERLRTFLESLAPAAPESHAHAHPAPARALELPDEVEARLRDLGYGG